MTLHQEIFHLLNQHTRYFAKELNNRLTDHDLYASQWSIIFCLHRFGPMTQTEIWKYLNVEAPTITRTLTRMEKSGWIIRKQGEDKRERVIELSDIAKEKFTTIRKAIDQFETEMLGNLTEKEKEQLRNLLLKLKASGEKRIE